MSEHKLAYGRAQLDRSAGPDGPLTFVASSTGINRYGYKLRNEGWQLDNYNANPVVLWMHNPMQPPIGTGTALSKGGNIVLDAVTFDREDELARRIESKYRRGFLSAVSVSWDFVTKDGKPVLDWWRLSAEQMAGDEMFYDLGEVSAVTVPGDPRALIKQSRLALAKLGKELVELFDEQEHPDGTLTREQIHDAVRTELVAMGVSLEHKPVPTKDTQPDEPAGIDQDAARVVLAAFDLQNKED